MDPRTGQLIEGMPAHKARKKGYIPLTPEQKEALEQMSVEERIAWAQSQTSDHLPMRVEMPHFGPNRHERRKHYVEEQKRVRKLMKRQRANG